MLFAFRILVLWRIDAAVLPLHEAGSQDVGILALDMSSTRLAFRCPVPRPDQPIQQRQRRRRRRLRRQHRRRCDHERDRGGPSGPALRNDANDHADQHAGQHDRPVVIGLSKCGDGAEPEPGHRAGGERDDRRPSALGNQADNQTGHNALDGGPGHDGEHHGPSRRLKPRRQAVQQSENSTSHHGNDRRSHSRNSSAEYSTPAAHCVPLEGRRRHRLPLCVFCGPGTMVK